MTEIVYTNGGSTAAIKVGETEDGHPVVVELGQPVVIEPEDGSYDIANEYDPATDK